MTPPRRARSRWHKACAIELAGASLEVATAPVHPDTAEGV